MSLSIIPRISGSGRMYRLLLSAIILIIFSSKLTSQNSDHTSEYGLRFTGNYDYPFSSYTDPDKILDSLRTGLRIPAEGSIPAGGRYSLEFDLAFRASFSFGNIVKITTDKYELMAVYYHDKAEKKSFIRFGLNNETPLSEFTFTDESLITCRFSRFTLSVDEYKGELNISYRGKSVNLQNAGILKSGVLSVSFGYLNDKLDCPDIMLKDITIISEYNQRYKWRLDKVTGDLVSDENKGVIAKVKNPRWIISERYNWTHTASFKSEKDNINRFFAIPDQHEIIILYDDKIVFYNYINKSYRELPLQSTIRNIHPLYKLYDPETHLIYLVSAVPDKLFSVNIKTGEVMGDISTKAKSGNAYGLRLFSGIEPDHSVYMFGGYGYYKFRSGPYKWNETAETWDFINLIGTPIYPRNMMALIKGGAGQLYILGGRGSKTGNQADGVDFFYDLYSLDLRTSSVMRMWERKDENGFTGSAAFIIPGRESEIFSLFNQEYANKVRSRLRLHNISDTITAFYGSSLMTLPGVETDYILLFEEATSELYFIFQRNEGKDTYTEVYTLRYPFLSENEYNTLMERDKETPAKFSNWLIYAGAGISVVILWMFISTAVKRRRNSGRSKLVADVNQPGTESLENAVKPINNTGHGINSEIKSITFFDGLQIMTAGGENLASKFSPRLTEFFTLILYYSFNKPESKGLANDQATAILWEDLDAQQIKNNRNVAINGIRKILHGHNGIVIEAGGGYIKANISQDCFNEISDFFILIRKIEKNSSADKNDLEKLFGITDKGTIFKGLKGEWFEQERSLIINRMIEILIRLSEAFFSEGDFEYTIRVTERVLNLDRLNEEALVIQLKALFRLGRHTVLAERYKLFAREYQVQYGENFKRSLNDLIS